MKKEAVIEELEYLQKIRYGLKPNSEIYIKKNNDGDIFNYIKDNDNVGLMDIDISPNLLKDNTYFIHLEELNQIHAKENNIKFVIFKFCIIENVWIVVKLSDNGYMILDLLTEKPTFEKIEDFDFNFLQDRTVETSLYKYINFTFETMEILLHTISPGFRLQFKDSLINKLQLELENCND
ncbi:hypothetical protein BCR36DRAFT_360060 [Piromyces finnis]|uniref:GSKIP domain-containing protein n=1 Tax=Piromyces finnis TaxID=1754191 RepID=A0A1Y1UZH9_9FUNG|nr:hypothetical protein BCR36DRAFT_360060 [Piromyces finnis]|eukprot:ORX44143.1 hypothetical protein BCR36DRAFT_360060 [Piromyces finnis]